MKAPALGITLAVIWLAAAPAGAHRLDEYLQATRLSLDISRVGVEIDLTPGVSVAHTAFGWIDANHDGEISDSEGQAYAGEVLRGLALAIDGQPVPIKLTQAAYPTMEEMSLGMGTIRVRAVGTLTAARAGHHALSFLNSHKPESSVYLVNALVPDDPRVRIGGQRRDPAQHGLRLDYDVTADPSWSRAALLTGLVCAAVVMMARKRST